jgi:hypothetical protein
MPVEATHTVSASSGGGEESRPIFTLEFVNMNASSKAEKQRNQKVIRSTAMKNFRRRQQSQRAQTKEGNKTLVEVQHQVLPQRIRVQETSTRDDEKETKDKNPEPTEIKIKDEPEVQGVSSQEMDDWISQTSFMEPWPRSQTIHSDFTGGDEDVEDVDIETSLSYSPPNNFFLLGSPSNLLGGGRIDPFRVYPAGYVGPHVNELIDHCESRSLAEIEPLVRIIT